MMSFYFSKKYEILDKINQGGMASIYKARDKESGMTVALKELLPRLVSDRRVVRELSREAKMAIKFNHPNVIKIFKLRKERKSLYLVMEYVEGSNLKELMIRKDEVVAKDPLLIILGIGRGLNHIHQHGIIHRDIKPENVLISREGEAKITDFGLALDRRVSKFFSSGSVDGTIAYMSPEQIRGKKVDERSDIYSFGVTMYEILTGRIPFPGEDKESMAKMHLDVRTVPKPLSVYAAVHPQLEQVTLKALEKKADRRYKSVAEMLLDLERIWRQLYEQ